MNYEDLLWLAGNFPPPLEWWDEEDVFETDV